ncbi:hypothetical protein HF521_000797 [Silurus meridionalis]|uniref:Prohibitin n=1 Tax=Silurus meridionalis TaxID=175797 RepID=A0A8T0C0E5_SILME|nr:hypothetical protein HF521_000797 [Silurus meridionalis]
MDAILSEGLHYRIPWFQYPITYDIRAKPCRISFLTLSLFILRELFERAKDFNIILDDIAITELSFSREYSSCRGQISCPAGGTENSEKS